MKKILLSKIIEGLEDVNNYSNVYYNLTKDEV